MYTLSYHCSTSAGKAWSVRGKYKLLTQLSHTHPSNTELLQHLREILTTRGEFEQV